MKVLKNLPRSLLPNPNSAVLPPTYSLGWVFDAPRVALLSKKYNIAVLKPEDSDDEDDNDDEDVREANQYYRSLGVERNFDIAFTAAAVAEYLLKEAKVVIPFEEPLSVLACPEGPRLAVVLCDNYHYDYKPTEAQICELQELFGFTEPPTWMLDANKRDWSDRKERDG